MRNLDILDDEKRGNRYHWYAIDIDTRAGTGKSCCSTSGKGGKFDGFNDQKSAKQAGATWNKTRIR